MKEIVLKVIYKYLALLSRIYISRTKPFVVGITGSVGKTSCRMIITQIMQKYLAGKIIYTSPKNFNSELGLVFSIFQVNKYEPGIKSLVKITLDITKKTIFGEKDYDVIILEYGIDHPGDMDFLLSIVKPDVGIFTKLDYIHVANFPNGIEGILNEKIKLIKASKKKVYLNYLDEYLRGEYENLNIEKDYFANLDSKLHYEREKDDIYSVLDFGVQKIKTNMLGEENMLYIELGYRILADIFDISFEEEEYIELQNQPGRFSILKGINDSILIDSTYNAGPESMKKMILNALSLRNKSYPSRKLALLIGDMRELGDFSENEHKSVYEIAKDADLILSVGEQTRAYFPKSVKNFRYSRDAGLYLKNILEISEDSYIVLFKGSQNTIFMEEALKQVLLNDEDKEKLVRQDFDWRQKKRDYI